MKLLGGPDGDLPPRTSASGSCRNSLKMGHDLLFISAPHQPISKTRQQCLIITSQAARWRGGTRCRGPGNRIPERLLQIVHDIIGIQRAFSTTSPFSSYSPCCSWSYCYVSVSIGQKSSRRQDSGLLNCMQALHDLDPVQGIINITAACRTQRGGNLNS